MKLFRHIFIPIVFLFTGLILPPAEAVAQTIQHFIDQDTEVRKIQFIFKGQHTFSKDELAAQISTKAPSSFDKVLFWRDAFFPFDPIELQRDVARLRLFYQRNGFLRTQISYFSDFKPDTVNNTVRVILSIEEGAPIEVDAFDVVDLADRPIQYLFKDSPKNLRKWRNFKNNNFLKPGDRYTDFVVIETQSKLLSFLFDRGFAFAKVSHSITIDSLSNSAHVSFTADPGPLTYFDEVIVEGTTDSNARVVQRQMPFKIGQRYEGWRVTEGQRRVFALNVFKYVLVDIPEQPRDSTVALRFRVSAARPKILNAQASYDLVQGVGLRGSWTHRNFFGNGRNFTASIRWATGLGATESENTVQDEEIGAAITVREPYILTRRLTGIGSIFYEFIQNNAQQYQEAGFSSSLIYEFHRFRLGTFTYALTKLAAVDKPSFFSSLTNTDIFDKSIFSFNATFGKTDDYLNPTNGYLIRPAIAYGGGIVGDVQYLKLSVEATGYFPISQNIAIAGRLFAGDIFPLATSYYDPLNLTSNSDTINFNRFESVRFYAGGANDVRGWSRLLLGNKNIDEATTLFQPQGGLAKILTSVELRIGIPGIESISTGLFFDAALLSETGTQFTTEMIFPSIGAGIRVKTPVGPIRIDLGYKLRVDESDKYNADQFLLPANERTENKYHRWALHFSIGQAF